MSNEALRVCPSCGYEYEEWVEVCPDCNMPVEVQPAKLELVRGALGGDDDDPRWTVVTNVPNAIIGNLIKNQLEDAGIPVLMMRSPSADIGHFSHNDYVPHDIRVPFKQMREARRLIDSPPGGNLLAQEWEDFNAEEDEAVEREEGNEQGSLPEGWSVLPTETDTRARQMLRRSMGTPKEGWYWSDRKRSDKEGDARSFLQEMYNRSAAGTSFRQKEAPAVEDEYEEEYEDYSPNRNGDPYAPNKWVRLFYAILLLVMSLPFIFQLLGTLFSFGQDLP